MHHCASFLTWRNDTHVGLCHAIVYALYQFD